MDPSTLVPSLIQGVSGGGVLTIVYLTFQIIFNKKLRTPADDQARIEFSVKVLQDRITEANADREAMKVTTDWMRAELDKRDRDKAADFNEKQELYEKIVKLQDRINAKDDIIRELRDRQTMLAAKAARGEFITAADIFGVDDERATAFPPDLDDTITREDLDRV